MWRMRGSEASAVRLVAADGAGWRDEGLRGLSKKGYPYFVQQLPGHAELDHRPRAMYALLAFSC
ncbi:hypothetical protein C0Z17_28530 [Trinickia caryophylli]|nr:hypothetical protein C0Z17_28530 [Trinickia caryophylli]